MIDDRTTPANSGLALSIGFWNVANKVDLETLALLVREKNLDILLLAESHHAVHVARDAFTTSSGEPFYIAAVEHEILQAYWRGTDSTLSLVEYGLRSAAFSLAKDGIEPILLVLVHLRSKMQATDIEQAFSCVDLGNRIRKLENAAGHSRTILLGDLNMNPFEPGIVAASGLHAVSNTLVAMRGRRIVGGERREFFYNPMWRFLGDAAEPGHGTYFYDRSNDLTYFWNVFDQVLVRPALLSRMKRDSVEIVTEIDGQSLCSSRGTLLIPEISDHLPIVLRLSATVSGGTFS